MALLYTKLTGRYMGEEMDRNKATNKIYHQAYSKFEEYNILGNIENVTNLGSKSASLPEPVSMLAVRNIEVTRRYFGNEYKNVTNVFAPNSAVQVMSFMIQLERWIQDHIRPPTILHLKDLGIVEHRRPPTGNKRPRMS